MSIHHKKGQSLPQLMTLSVFAFAFIILLGTTLYFFGEVNNALTGSNIISGGLNYSNFSADTIGVVNEAFLDQADLIGIFFIFGVILLLFVSGYINRESTPALLLIVDIIILIFAYIIAVYMANSYEQVIVSLPFLDLITANLNTTSTIMLNLPTIVVVAGMITMIISYAGIPRTREEQVGGF